MEQVLFCFIVNTMEYIISLCIGKIYPILSSRTRKKFTLFINSHRREIYPYYNYTQREIYPLYKFTLEGNLLSLLIHLSEIYPPTRGKFSLYSLHKREIFPVSYYPQKTSRMLQLYPGLRMTYFYLQCPPTGPSGWKTYR